METPLGVLEDRDVFVWGMWIQVGFIENGQIVEPQEVFGWEGALTPPASPALSRDGLMAGPGSSGMCPGEF